ncbi:MAG: hypothetical protein WHS82_03415 [Candidatus Methanosuratincola sp.]
MTVLDVLVDGEIIKEAMLVDNSDGEEIIYKGPGLGKKIKSIASILIDRIPAMNYFVLALPKKKYVVLAVSSSKYLVLGIGPEINSEKLISQLTKTLRELGFDRFEGLIK